MSRFSLLAVLLFTVVLSSANCTPTLQWLARAEAADASPEAEMSPEPTPELSPEESLEPEESSEPVCVDEQYLLDNGHTVDTFVHKVGNVVNAYCPQSTLPCASEHHMLRINGKSMSYRQYCHMLPCERRMVKVNSVFTHLWEETTHDDATLTMFDVRHPEAAQKMLHWTMHKLRKVGM